MKTYFSMKGIFLPGASGPRTCLAGLLLCLAAPLALAQSCPVPPVYTNTFGAGAPGGGAANWGPELPAGQTTYTYKNGSPDAINQYAITQNPRQNHVGWVDGPDHTGDPNGYMMLVNGSTTAGTFYVKDYTVVPGARYLFSSWIASAVINPPYGYLADPNVKFQLLDPGTNAILAEVATGPIPESPGTGVPPHGPPAWAKYDLYFVPASATVRLRMINNSPAPNGNDLVLDDITMSAAPYCEDITSAKSVTDAGGNGVAEPGETLTYSIVLTNNSPTFVVADYVHYDKLDANTTFVSASDGGTFDPITGLITWGGLDIAISGTKTLTVTVTVNNPLPPGVDHVTNATFGPIDTPPDCTATPTPKQCAILPTIQVYLDKKTTTTTAQAGVPIDYTLTATNASVGTTQAAGYTFTEVVPANTTFTSVSGGGTSNCTAGAVEGTKCTITITNPIAGGASASVIFTVTPVGPLPTNVTTIGNQVYYDKPPTNCSLTGTPVCNPVQPTCSGTTCDMPPATCTAGDPACVSTPIVHAAAVPVGDGLRWMLLLMLGWLGVLAVRRQRR